MSILRVGITLAVTAAAGSLIGVGAQAADAARAWGTIGSPGQQFLNSDLGHSAAGTSAQQIAAGQTGGPFHSVTACGTCVTFSITGNQNSINGNSITQTNTGSVTNTGTFNFF
jgi:hypothetical protein